MRGDSLLEARPPEEISESGSTRKPGRRRLGNPTGPGPLERWRLTAEMDNGD